MAFTLDGSRFDSSGPKARRLRKPGTPTPRSAGMTWNLRPYLGYLPASLPIRLKGGHAGRGREGGL